MEQGREPEWFDGLEARPYGFAHKAGNVPPFQRLWVSDDEEFCRHCEFSFHAGEPFTIGAHGKYCQFCLKREGWELVQAGNPTEQRILPPGFIRRLLEGDIDFGME